MMSQNRTNHTQSDTAEEPLFIQLVAPAFRRAQQLQRQFERKNDHDVAGHQSLLDEIEQAEHNVWQAIALATVDINPGLITEVTKAAPLPLSKDDKQWIAKCLQTASLPLIEEGSFTPIRFLQGRL